MDIQVSPLRPEFVALSVFKVFDELKPQHGDVPEDVSSLASSLLSGLQRATPPKDSRLHRRSQQPLKRNGPSAF